VVTWFTLIAKYKSLCVAFDIVFYSSTLLCCEIKLGIDWKILKYVLNWLQILKLWSKQSSQNGKKIAKARRKFTSKNK
jgi:hypothetical protein